MAETGKIILIFEDESEARDSLAAAIQNRVSIVVKAFGASSSPLGTGSGTFEERLFRILKTPEYSFERVGLIVCDKDLSTQEGFTGLSATNVSETAERMGIPYCEYARGMSDDETDVLRKKASWAKKDIFLNRSLSDDEMAAQIVCLYNGFTAIGSQISQTKKEAGAPSDLLACILGHPELADRISLYGAGEQGMLESILPYAMDSKTDSILTENRRIRILGNWLLTSILRYPGILVNEVATASYLDIAPECFRKEEVKKPFLDAKYDGPFSDLKDYWWRHELDILLEKKEVDTGYDYVRQEGVGDVEHCKCSVTGKSPAGYYCMITKEPISDEASSEAVSWFPSGADLARVSKEKFDELAPWLSI